MQQLLSWQQLDYISDAYNPLLFFTALLLILRQFVNHELQKGVKFSVLLSLGLLSVYALRWTDERYQLWPSLNLDYSTHTAFALCMAWIIHRVIAKQIALQILLWLSLFGYFVLMVYQDYHSTHDIISTVVVFTCIMTLIDFIIVERILREEVTQQEKGQL